MEGPARAWSIVALSLLCTVLCYVLLRTPPSPRPAAPEDTTPTEPAPTSPSPSPAGSPYRAWPMFQGWPLPQPPASAPPAPESAPQKQ